VRRRAPNVAQLPIELVVVVVVELVVVVVPQTWSALQT
jgi:hypothetical protein